VAERLSDIAADYRTGWPPDLSNAFTKELFNTYRSLVRFYQPFGFLDYNRLQTGARCVLSDSGTIAEESTILAFPAVTLRSSIERPEALDTGAITMTDLQPEAVLRGIRFANPERPADYQVTNTSERVVNFILSTAFQHEFWSGLR
jgi:UDP-N-acetylglucosamine 2-epimerase (non-hydrolysing)